MESINPRANYPITEPVVLEHLGCSSVRAARRLAQRTDAKRLPTFKMFGRLMIGGQELLDYTERVRHLDDAPAGTADVA